MKRPDQDFLSRLMDGEWRDLDVRRSVLDVCGDETLRAKWARYHLARDAMRHEALDPSDSLAERVRAALEQEPAYSNVTAISPLPFEHGGRDVDARGGAWDRGQSEERLAGAAARRSEASGVSAPNGTAVAATSSLERDERPVIPAAPSRGARVRTFAGGFGLAAGVALVTVVGLDALRDGEGDAPVGTSTHAAVTDVADDEPETLVAGTSSGARGAFSRQLPGAPLPEVELVANTGAYWVAPDRATRRADSEQRLNRLLSQHIENSPTAERQGMLPYSRLVGYDELAPER